MTTNLPNEQWKQVIFNNWDKLQKKYAISNMGRIASYTKDVKKDGMIIKGSTVEDYNIIRLKVLDKYPAFLLHRLVASYFLKQPSSLHEFVIHLNHKKKDNRSENLQWATKEEVTEHNSKNPRVVKAKKQAKEKYLLLKKGMKLTLAQVIRIKKMLFNPKRKLTYKQLAEKYRVSEMAITRIKSGENWGHVHI